MTKIIALSGGIGSGKSSVSTMLGDLGACIVDADAIVHELQGPGTPLLAEIAETFGEAVIGPDGALDRAALSDIVFRSPDLRKQLERLVHPRVISEMQRRAQQAAEAGTPLVVMDIPLLFEGQKRAGGSAAVMGYAAMVLVWVPQKVQIERTMKRDSCDRAEVERRMQAQLPIEEKKAMASHVIDNSGAPASTREQVEALYSELTSAS
jgi:dephospho-CoA kinase